MERAMKKLLLLIVFIWSAIVVGAVENQFNFKTVEEFKHARKVFESVAQPYLDKEEPNFYLISFDPSSDNYEFKTRAEL